MNRILPSLVGLAACWSLIGCLDDRTAGNTTQTENTVTARTIRVDSVLPVWSHPWVFCTVVTLRLDSTNFDFKRTDSAGHDLAVQTLDGDSIPFDVVDWEKTARSGRIQVRLDWPLLVPGAKFLLRWSQPLKRRSDPVSVWRGFPDSERLALTSFLIDDFQDGSLNSLLPSGNGWYKATSDSSVTAAAPVLAAAGAGRAGRAIHLAYNVPNAGGYALLGLTLGSNGEPRKLRGMDSLVFWARGTGKLSIAFDRLKPHTLAKTWTHRMLDTAWTRYRFRPIDFDTADGIGNNVGWNATCDSVTHFSLLVSGGGDLWVDSVRIFGLDRDDLK